MRSLDHCQIYGVGRELNPTGLLSPADLITVPGFRRPDPLQTPYGLRSGLCPDSSQVRGVCHSATPAQQCPSIIIKELSAF